MNKQELLQQVRNLASQSLVTKQELLNAYDQSEPAEIEGKEKHPRFARILYYIGAAIVFVGIVIMVYQNWSDFNTFTKILATFGSGIAAYLVGVFFNYNKKVHEVGNAFFLIAALILPLGLSIIFDSAGFDVGRYEIQTLISAIMFVVFLVSLVIFRRTIFTFFSIVFGTWLFFSITGFMVRDIIDLNRTTFSEYRFLLTGLAYMFLGYSFSKRKGAALTGPLYGFGSLFFLGSALALGGWSPDQNIFWELIYVGLVFGVIFMSIKLYSRSLLVFGSIFLMAYILKITVEYFTEGLGWSLSLIIAGLILVGVGYLSVDLNRRYFSNSRKIVKKS
tara:strand:- start:1993 stop:2994 length:1002 start_codon:yes stop_codon:yes gene_type:complete